MDRAKIAEYLKKETNNINIEVYKELPSTNLLLKEYARQGKGEGSVVIAQKQSSGKGRLGRSFFSPEGGIYMSILLRPSFRADQALILTTLAAVATAEAIEEVSGEDMQIKWVNDIFKNGKKVCGILCEASPDIRGDIEYAILGIGINLTKPKEGFPPEIQNIADAVFEKELPENAKEKIIAGIINRVMLYYKGIPGTYILNEYRRRSFIIGRNIYFTHEGKRQSAVVLGIDENFCLDIKMPDNSIRKLNSGEVSIKI